MGEKDQNPLKITNHTSDIYIATFNTRSLRTNEKRIELELAIAEIKWDIIGISEMRRHGEGIEDYGDYIYSTLQWRDTWTVWCGFPNKKETCT